ncbi:glutathione S-transferase N-terminal domain-containing protein [Streptomyces sp. 4F14]|uniref:glutathione S-transferase N-terminal domain-containing protein n=1 Tax=Streptomyces sp. 4F14 TaxID=3394380 RepID=UPI003A8AB5EB
MTEHEQSLTRVPKKTRTTRPHGRSSLPAAVDADGTWYLDSPSLARWLEDRVEGRGWDEEPADEFETAPWAEFRIRTGAVPAGS